ncbi:unnamed protein product [Durusdinium trenchii]|uniref:Uncharacterized protein n=1 Tax=Durusdinium trenchii TaxID=1381693 RepID=A0ABP0MVZ9_9DINO
MATQCTWKQVRLAVAELNLLKEKSPTDLLAAVETEALKVAQEVENTEQDLAAKRSLALAEATLLAAGPGEDFKSALQQAQEQVRGASVTGAEGASLDVELLQLEALAALTRRSPRAFRAAVPAVAVPVSSQMPKVLALDSIASRLCDDFDNAIGTAQQLIELHRGQVDLECWGEVLLSSAALARASCHFHRNGPPSPTPPGRPPGFSMTPLAGMYLEDLKRAHAAAERAFALSSRSYRVYALQRLCEVMSLKGLATEAEALVQREIRNARAAKVPQMECGALVALVLLEPKTFTEEVLGRLKTLKESEKAQMEVALLAAQHVTSDEAVSYLQHALSLARQCRDFLREAEALQQLTELHERMGLWPPRSEWRSACISKLRAASEESVQQQTLQPLLDALHTVEDAGFRVEELLHRKDLQQATASIPSNADWWLRAKAEVRPVVAAAVAEREPGLTEGNWQGVQPLSMVEVVKEELYRDVRVGGVQYGPRYRQVQGFRPPLKLMSSGKPAVVGVLRPSSEAEEWETRTWDWAPPLVDAAAHSSFLFGQKGAG